MSFAARHAGNKDGDPFVTDDRWLCVLAIWEVDNDTVIDYDYLLKRPHDVVLNFECGFRVALVWRCLHVATPETHGVRDSDVRSRGTVLAGDLTRRLRANLVSVMGLPGVASGAIYTTPQRINMADPRQDLRFRLRALQFMNPPVDAHFLSRIHETSRDAHVTAEQLGASVFSRGFVGPYGPKTSRYDSTHEAPDVFNTTTTTHTTHTTPRVDRMRFTTWDDLLTPPEEDYSSTISSSSSSSITTPEDAAQKRIIQGAIDWQNVRRAVDLEICFNLLRASSFLSRERAEFGRIDCFDARTLRWVTMRSLTEGGDAGSALIDPARTFVTVHVDLEAADLLQEEVNRAAGAVRPDMSRIYQVVPRTIVVFLGYPRVDTYRELKEAAHLDFAHVSLHKMRAQWALDHSEREETRGCCCCWDTLWLQDEVAPFAWRRASAAQSDALWAAVQRREVSFIADLM